MRRIVEEIEDYVGTKEIVVSIILTIIFLFASYIGHTTLVPTQITVRSTQVEVYTTYYGFPFHMVGVLTAVTSYQRQHVSWYTNVEGHGVFQIQWTGVVFNTALFFLLAFFISYLLKRISSHLIERSEKAHYSQLSEAAS